VTIAAYILFVGFHVRSSSALSARWVAVSH
jgi:hypothetical protein